MTTPADDTPPAADSPLPDQATTPMASQEPPRRLTRSAGERMIGGVCGGIGRHFAIDPTLVRIGAVALVLLGGAGLVIYGAALLLVPLEGAGAPAPSQRDKLIAAVLVIAGIAVGCTSLVGGIFVPIGIVAAAGLGVWWFVSGERPSANVPDLLRRAAKGVALLAGCAALAAGSFLASGLGGDVVVAALVIVAGAGLVGAAFVGGARWLILPALAVALPLAFVSAAGIDLNGGFGKRDVKPATLAEVGSSYKLGAGELVVDLRDVDLEPGDRRLKLRVGAGHVVVLVKPNVCVASAATIGAGAVQVFNHDGGGVDVAWKDSRQAPADTPRLIIDADMGLGFLEVRHDFFHSLPHHHHDDHAGSNAACAGASA